MSEQPAPLSFDDADTITKLASILSRTNGVGPILAQRISEIVAPVLSNFASKIKQTEAQRDSLQKAFLRYVEWHGSCLECHTDDADSSDSHKAEAAAIDAQVNAALSGLPAQAGEDVVVKALQ